MAKASMGDLSRRERQIMEAIYAKGEATAHEIQAALPEAPGYSAVRALLRILVDKGALRHEQRGKRYVYFPVAARAKVRDSALKQLLKTFFAGSTEQAVAALIDLNAEQLTAEQLDRLAERIEQARKEGK